MPKKIISLSELYELKLNIKFKSLVWYRSPLNPNSSAIVTMFGIRTSVGFGDRGHTHEQNTEIEYHIRDNKQFSQFFERNIIIEITNGYSEGNNESKVVGYCELDPKLVTEKNIIAPILSFLCPYDKLGDISVEFKLTRSVTSLEELEQINEYLDNLLTKNPEQFDYLYNDLLRKGIINKNQNLQ